VPAAAVGVSAVACGVAHTLAALGDGYILATFCSGQNAWSPAAIAAVNAYYGRGALPVAAVKGSGVELPSPYAQQLAQRVPRRLATGDAVRDALPAYRELLAAQPDHSVVVLTVGYATNLRNLLASPPDRCSPLPGRALAAAKVIRWVNMGGNFERRPGIDDTNVNWTRDAAAAAAADPDALATVATALVPAHGRILLIDNGQPGSARRLLDGLTLPWAENTRPATDIDNPTLATAADEHRAIAANSWRTLTTPPPRDRGRDRDRGHGLDID
jgi:hypothetical protein